MAPMTVPATKMVFPNDFEIAPYWQNKKSKSGFNHNPRLNRAISPTSMEFFMCRGFTKEQVEGWKLVTKAVSVHEQGNQKCLPSYSM